VLTRWRSCCPRPRRQASTAAARVQVRTPLSQRSSPAQPAADGSARQHSSNAISACEGHAHGRGRRPDAHADAQQALRDACYDITLKHWQHRRTGRLFTSKGRCRCVHARWKPRSPCPRAAWPATAGAAPLRSSCASACSARRVRRPRPSDALLRAPVAPAQPRQAVAECARVRQLQEGPAARANAGCARHAGLLHSSPCGSACAPARSAPAWRRRRAGRRYRSAACGAPERDAAVR
jgi:hypothetical protein